MRARHAPLLRAARRFDRVTDVLAVAERGLPEEHAAGAAAREAVAGVRAHLPAADVELHGAVDRPGGARGGAPTQPHGAGRTQARRLAEPGGLEVLAHAFTAAFASEAALPIAAEAAGGVEHVGAVHPHH